MSSRKETYRLKALYQKSDILFPKLGLWPATGLFTELFSDTPKALKIVTNQKKKSKGKDTSFYGHSMFDYSRSHCAEAYALIAAEKKIRAKKKLVEMGYYFEGASLEGHAYPLMAMMGSYDRTENFPPMDFPFSNDAYDYRLQQRNLLLRKNMRDELAATLALKNSKISYQYSEESQLSDALNAEMAFLSEDYVIARGSYKKMANFTYSWNNANVADPRAEAAFGLGRIATKQSRHALAYKYARDCLEINSCHQGGLLLAASSSIETQFLDRAKNYVKKIRTHFPLENISYKGFCLSDIESQLDMKAAKRGAADAGFQCLKSKDYASANLRFSSVLGKRKRDLLKGRRKKVVAAFLFSLACVGDYETLLEESERFLAIDKTFISARESLSFALFRLNRKKESKTAFLESGLSHLLEGRPWTHVEWAKSKPNNALSPIPNYALKRIRNYLENTSETKVALEMMRVLDPPLSTDPIRFLIASSLFYNPIRATKKIMEEAFFWLEPLVKKNSEKNPYHIATMELALELLTGLKKWEELVEIPIVGNVQSYLSLTGASYQRMLPLLSGAYLKLGRPREACALFETHFIKHVKEFTNHKLLFLYLGALKKDKRRMAKEEEVIDFPPKKTLKMTNVEWVKEYMSSYNHCLKKGMKCIEENREEEESPSVKARKLTTQAWRLEQKGDDEGAMEAYLEVAELDIKIASIGLANAGNTLTKKKEWKRSYRFLHAALFCCHTFPPSSRACVLDKVAYHFSENKKYATALPSAIVAFEFQPSASRAFEIAQIYKNLDDKEQQSYYEKIVRELEPRWLN